jgi:hypothetical protein
VTAGGGAGTLFKVTSGTLTVTLSCTGANCQYNGTPNTVLVGQPVTLTAAARNAIPGTVIWTSSQGVFSGPNPAASITFTPTGAGGPVVIQATPVANPAIKASEIMLNTIATGGGGGGGSGSLTILSSASQMVAGTTFQFTANQPVTWTASAGTIDPNTGEFTAPNPPPDPATVTITATSQSSSSSSATTKVTIFAQPKLVLPASVTLPAGGSVSVPISLAAGTGILGEALMFACAPANLPTGVTCLFSPNPVVNSANAQLSLQLSSAIVGQLMPMRDKSWKRFSAGGPYVIVAACVLWMRRRARRTGRGRILSAILGFIFITLLSACGTGGSFSTTPTQGHLTGTYTLNIVVSGATLGAADLNQTVATAPLSVTLQ